MTDYHRRADIELAPALVALAPTEARAFVAFNHACAREDGVVPARYRELISLAVALTTQCAYCIDVHAKAAVKAGATRAEFAETAMIAAAVRAGGTLAHGLLGLRLFDEAATPISRPDRSG